MASTLLTTAQASRIVGVSPSVLRTWERRFPPAFSVRTKGGHRRFDRLVCLGLRKALMEGLTGEQAVARMRELTSCQVTFTATSKAALIAKVSSWLVKQGVRA